MAPPEVIAVSRPPRRGTQHLVDGVVMNERALPPAAGAEPLRQHRDAFVELLAPQVPVGIRAAHQIEQVILAAIPAPTPRR